MLITRWQSIELFMEGRERRGICSPPSLFMPRCLTSGLGSRDRPMLPRSGCQAPGSSLHGVSSSLCAQTHFCSESLLLLAQFIPSNHTINPTRAPQVLFNETSYKGFVDPVMLILCQGSQWAIRYPVQRQKVVFSLLWSWCFWSKTLALQRTSVSWESHTQASLLQRGASRKCVGEERKERGRGEDLSPSQRTPRSCLQDSHVLSGKFPGRTYNSCSNPRSSACTHNPFCRSTQLLFIFKTELEHSVGAAVERAGRQEAALWECVCASACVVCACVRVLNNFMDICHAQLTLHCCILSCRPRLGRQW